MITSFSLKQLAKIVNGELLNEDATFFNVSHDTRNLVPGTLFIAIQGKNFDGHDFTEQAKQAGATALLIEKEVLTDLPQLCVKNTRSALAELTRYHRERYAIPLVAITGSNGKTTTKTLLASILMQRGKVLYNEASFNNDIGLPLTLLQQNIEHDFAVVEMGANHLGEIASLTQIARPEIAIITNIGPAHLQGFGNIAGVIDAKSEIFQGLKSEGVAIVNYDQPYVETFKNALAQNNQLITFGLKSGADIQATDIEINNNQTKLSFKVKIAGKSMPMVLNFLGKHNVYNALAAAAAAWKMGLSLEEIASGLQEAKPVAKRLNLVQGLNGAKVLDDSYNAIPNAVLAALDVLSEYNGEKIFAFGGMAELGENPEQYYREIAFYAKKKGVNKFFILGEYSSFTAEIFGEGGYSVKNKQDLILQLKNMLTSESVVLVKGSRGSKMEEVVKGITKD